MEPKFKLGRIVITPGAIDALATAEQDVEPFLIRHVYGDWGDLCPEDRQHNEDAIAHEGDLEQQARVVSTYRTSRNVKLYVITEWDRSVTTILLPEEY